MQKPAAHVTQISRSELRDESVIIQMQDRIRCDLENLIYQRLEQEIMALFPSRAEMELPVIAVSAPSTETGSGIKLLGRATRGKSMSVTVEAFARKYGITCASAAHLIHDLQEGTL